MTFPTLYKMTSTGAIQEWKIEVMDHFIPDHPTYTIRYGQVDGKKIIANTKFLTGKNIGKANETTALEQCALEARSHWNKQKDRKGYTEKIPTEKPLRPMLALKYKDHGHKIKFPCYGSLKLDGIRALAKKENGKVKLFSRLNKEFLVLDHIVEKLTPIMKDGDIWDGELYNHDIDFQEIISAVKRDEKKESTELIQYWVYDKISNKDFQIRFSELGQSIPLSCSIIKIVHNIICDEDELVGHHNDFVNRGFEGMMIRNLKGPYKINGRSKDLQKYKAFTDEEFKIIGVKKVKTEGMCSFICETKIGATFDCMPKGSGVVRRKYFTDWNSGKIKKGDLLTVEFFGWTTTESGSVPRFPTGKGVRDYE